MKFAARGTTGMTSVKNLIVTRTTIVPSTSHRPTSFAPSVRATGSAGGDRLRFDHAQEPLRRLTCGVGDCVERRAGIDPTRFDSVDCEHGQSDGLAQTLLAEAGGLASSLYADADSSSLERVLSASLICVPIPTHRSGPRAETRRPSPMQRCRSSSAPRTDARPRSPRRRRRSGSRQRRRSASRQPSTVGRLTIRHVCSSTARSTTAPGAADVTTASPAAIASTSTRPKTSYSDGNARMSARRVALAHLVVARSAPRKRMVRGPDAASRFGSSGPSPMTVNRRFGNASLPNSVDDKVDALARHRPRDDEQLHVR